MKLKAALQRPWSLFLSGPPTPGGRFDVTARDGVRLALHRVHPEGEPGSVVLLLHGLSSNRHAFNFPGRSFAAFLATRGFDCFVPELRGAGESERPPYRWRVDDYLQHDLPAILETIQKVTGKDELHWIGHSMGGILLLAYASMHPETRVTSGITIGSALDYRVGDSGFRWLLPLKRLIAPVPVVPYGTVMHWLSPVLGHRPSFRLEAFNAYPPNLEPAMMRRLHAIAFHAVPTSLLSSLSTLFDESGLTLQDGRRILDSIGRYKVPTLFVAGTKDEQAPAPAVEHTARLVSASSEVRIFGREHGDSEDYGHFDLIVGRRAAQETWPVMASWLERPR
jgi:pimeloyl-ACP methyl ester carboxylesterase